MNLRPALFKAAMLLSDAAFFLAAFVIVFWIRYVSGVFPAARSSYAAFQSIILFSLLLLVIVFQTFRLYQDKRTLFDEDEFYSIVRAVSLAFLIVITATFFFKATEQFSRVVLTMTFALSCFSISVGRMLLREVQGRARKKGFNTRNVLIVGEGSLAKMVRDKILDHPELGYCLKGVLPANKVDGLSSIAKKNNVSVVFIATRMNHDRLAHLIAENDQLRFRIVPSVIETITDAPSYEEFKDIPLVLVQEKDALQGYLWWKHSLDFAFATIMLLILSPLMLFIAILVKVSSAGSALYAQMRVGRHGRSFRFLKFRTMRDGAEAHRRGSEINGPLFKRRQDPRVTAIGHLLRRTCLDELPQLINVLRNEMSLVGPRPHLPEELRLFKRWQKLRLAVRPGMTGLWQVSGRHELNFEKTMMLDLYYVKHLSFWLDAKILLKTIPAIIFSGGRW
ncbi:MAG: sugar transferase [Nanoarchaeota archaeon]